MEKELNKILNEEGIINSSYVGWRKSKFQAFPAEFVLSNKSLVLYKKPSPFVGILGRLMVKMARGSLVFNVPLNDIKKIEDVKHGVTRILKIQLDNDQNYEVIVDKKPAETWRKLFKEKLPNTIYAVE